MKAINIEWDKEGLPTEVEIPQDIADQSLDDELDENIVEWLEEKFGAELVDYEIII